MDAKHHGAGHGIIICCLAALTLLALLSGCGFADYAQWERSLELPEKAPAAGTGPEAAYVYKCRPGYHLIPCPTCYRPLYRTERRCPGGRNCDYTRVEYRTEKAPCAFCNGYPQICEPDGYERGKNADSEKP